MLALSQPDLAESSRQAWDSERNASRMGGLDAGTVFCAAAVFESGFDSVWIAAAGAGYVLAAIDWLVGLIDDPTHAQSHESRGYGVIVASALALTPV